MASNTSSGRANYTLVQALRGIAAVWVVLFHTSSAQHVPTLLGALPAWLSAGLFDSGRFGVAIFFTLSGFVIAHSLSGTIMNGRRFRQFMLRRSIRLDPAYWVSIAIVIAVGVTASTLRDVEYNIPDIITVLAHVAYLQEILRISGIDVVYWTLTYEIQFYAVFALAMMVRGHMWPLLAIAILSAAGMLDIAPHGLFVHYWGAFFIGVLARHAIEDQRWLLALGILGALLTIDGWFGAINTATAALLYISVRTRWAETGLNWRWLQFLGLISYSLYLVHNPIISVSAWVSHQVLGTGVAADVATLGIVLSATVAGASILWALVERPTHRLSRRKTIVSRAKNTTTETLQA